MVVEAVDGPIRLRARPARRRRRERDRRMMSWQGGWLVPMQRFYSCLFIVYLRDVQECRLCPVV